MGAKRAYFAAESTTTTGVGDYVLDGALTSPTTYNAIGDDPDISDGDLVELTVRDSSDPTVFEEGQYTYNVAAGPGGKNTLSRTSILKSSNGGAAVDWGTGTKVVLSGPITSSLYMLGSNFGSEYAGHEADFKSTLGFGTMADEAAADYVPKTGATVTGAIVGPNPTPGSLEYATAQYAEGLVSADSLPYIAGHQVPWGRSASEALPTGWSLITSGINGKYLQFTTSLGNVGNTGGDTSVAAHLSVDYHTLAKSEVPPLTVAVKYDNYIFTTNPGQAVSKISTGGGSSASFTTDGGGGQHKHGISDSGGTFQPVFKQLGLIQMDA